VKKSVFELFYINIASEGLSVGTFLHEILALVMHSLESQTGKNGMLGRSPLWDKDSTTRQQQYFRISLASSFLQNS